MTYLSVLWLSVMGRCILQEDFATSLVADAFTTKVNLAKPLAQEHKQTNREMFRLKATNTTNHELSSYFDPAFQDAANQLSSTSIVEMLPKSPGVYSGKPLRQELFTSPIISVLYEKVLPPLWEAGLRIGGPDAEYAAAADFLCSSEENKEASKCKNDAKVLLDLSCGTGFVGLRFAASEQFDHVFALDYSPQMLEELKNSLQRQPNNSKKNRISIIRGDAGHLPFSSECIDAVYWGAAMHCVPSAEVALQEIYRVLKPGGRFYATTFLRPFPDVVFRFFTVPELEALAKRAAFHDVNVESKGVYGIIRATKK